MLLGAVVDEANIPPRSTLLDPLGIGTGLQIRPAESGVLYLRINDAPAEGRDNKGELVATVRKLAVHSEPPDPH
jgi:hypothetical protein